MTGTTIDTSAGSTENTEIETTIKTSTNMSTTSTKREDPVGIVNSRSFQKEWLFLFVPHPDGNSQMPLIVLSMPHKYTKSPLDAGTLSAI
jgi:hypothetical protein